jgi:hypothetical protein
MPVVGTRIVLWSLVLTLLGTLTPGLADRKPAERAHDGSCEVVTEVASFAVPYLRIAMITISPGTFAQI